MIARVAGESSGFFCKSLTIDLSLAEKFEDIAKEVVKAVPQNNTPFSIELVVRCGSRLKVSGYIYPDRTYGLIMFFRHSGECIKISIAEGVYTRVK